MLLLNQDVTVIGAGIIGICSALQLQRRGFKVTLLDRRPPASETSFGNAGVISRGSVFPEAAPGIHRKLPKILSNQSREARLHYRYLGHLAPWVRRVLQNTGPTKYEKNVKTLNEIVIRCLPEHRRLLGDSNKLDLLRENGWFKCFRHAVSFENSASEQRYLELCGIAFERLTSNDLHDLEGGLNDIFTGGLWIKNTASVTSPGAVCDVYTELFLKEGGSFVLDELKQIQWLDDRWQIECKNSVRESESVVLALGAWSGVVLKQLGYDVPMVVERGYHMHYQVQEGRQLGRPVYDVDGCYVMSPMQKGLRVTTGVEWGFEDTAPTPIQLKQVKPFVSEAINIVDELDSEPWLGRRPCTPDSLPIIGAAHKHKNLWLGFGHGHMGFSMGPITGQLLANLMTGERPAFDTTPFQLSRF